MIYEYPSNVNRPVLSVSAENTVKRLLALLAHALISVLLLSGEGVSQFIQTNGPYGGAILGLAAQPGFLFAGTSLGVYRSPDNVSSWQPLNLGVPNLRVSSLWADDQRILVTTQSGLYRSTDAGTSWALVDSGLPYPTSVNGIANVGAILFVGDSPGVYKSTDNGSTWVSTNFPTIDPIRALAASNSTIYAATLFQGIFFSTDSGTSWQGTSPIPSSIPPADITSLAVAGGRLFVGTGSDGLYQSTDNGTTWISDNQGLPGQPYVSTLFPIGSLLYAGVDNKISGQNLGGVYLFDDSSATWRPSGAGVTNQSISSFTMAGLSHTLYVGTRGAGVFSSSDGGVSWVPASNGIPEVLVSALISSKGTLFAAGGGGTGVFISTDNGNGWTLSNAGLPPNFSITHILLQGSILFAGGFDQGIFASTDRGKSWSERNSGLQSSLHDVRAMASDGSFLYLSDNGSAYRSGNEGSDWTQLTGFQSGAVATCFAFVDSLILAGTAGAGVFVSADRGTTWAPANSGLPPNLDVASLSVNGTRVYLGGVGKIFRSEDKGANWSLVSSSLPFKYYVHGITVVGHDMFALAGGLYYSGDGGTNWSSYFRTPSGDSLVSSIAFSGDQLVVGTFANGAWRRPLADFPTQIPISNLQLWLRADDGVVKDASNHVSQWSDVAGSNNHAYQQDPAVQPLFVTKGINGQPVLNFNANHLQTNLRPLDGFTAFTTFSVMRYPSNPQDYSYPFWNGIDSVISGYGAGYRKPGSPLIYSGWGSSRGELKGDAIYNGQTVINATIYDQKHHLYYIDGSLRDSIPFSGSNFRAGTFTVGSIGGSVAPFSYPFSGDIAEIILYDRALDDSARKAVESYLKLKYAIQPYFSPDSRNINFGNVPLDSSNQANVIVTNTGTGTLTLNAANSDNNQFAVSPQSAVILSQAKQIFAVTFHPTISGPANGHIVFSHDGPTSPDTVLVSGTGGTPPGQLTLTIRVRAGWNLFSMPLSVADASVAAVFANTSRNSPCYSYIGGYLVRDSVSPGVGYWVKFASDDSVVVTGYPYSHDSIRVVAGWNLIGSISYPLLTSAIAQVPSNNLTGYIWELHDGIYQAERTIVPGYGFWVFANAPGALVMDGTSCFAQSPPRFQQPPPKNSFTPLSAIVGKLLTFPVSASDVDPGQITLTSSALPAGSSMTPSLPVAGNPVSSTFSWTPAAQDTGVHLVTFISTDSCGLESFFSYSIMVRSSQNFVVPLKIKDALGDSTIVFWGNTFGATGCPDSAVGEIELPPPALGVDVRFTRPAALCHSQGIKVDLRPSVSPSQIDTFRVALSVNGAGSYPLVVTWPDLNTFYAGPVSLLDPYTGTNVDMKLQSSYVVPDLNSSLLRIITASPFARNGPSFSHAPQAVDFGPVPIGSNKLDSVTVSNDGDAPLVIGSVVSTNNSFSVSDSSAIIPPNANKKFYLTFAPSASGFIHAGIIFSHNASPKPDTIAVSGVGLTGNITIYPRAVNFRAVTVNDTAIRFTGLINTTATVNPIDTIILTGTNASEFSLSYGPDSSFLPGDTLTVRIKFSPQSVGTKSAFIVISSLSGSRLDTVLAGGTGTSPGLTVSLLAGVAPAPGIRVLLQDSSGGSLIADKTADTNGVVSFGDLGAQRATLSIVTSRSAQPQGPRADKRILTVFGVRSTPYVVQVAGDNLPTVATFNLQLSGIPAGTSRTRVGSRDRRENMDSQGFFMGFQVTSRDLQPADGRFSLIAGAFDTAGHLLGWGSAVDLDPAAVNGTTVYLAVDRTPLTVHFSAAESVGVDQVYIYRKGVSFQNIFLQGGSPFDTAGNVQIYSMDGAEKIRLEAVNRQAVNSSARRYGLNTSVPPTPTSFSIRLPDLAINSFTRSPDGNTLNWTRSGTGLATLDYNNVQLKWRGITQGGDSVQYEWEMVNDPATMASFMFPTLPSDLADQIPPLNGVDISLSLTDLDSTSGYEDLLQQLNARDGDYDAGVSFRGREILETERDGTFSPGAPQAPTLLSPADGASGLPSALTFQWNGPKGSLIYRLEVAIDSAFQIIFVSDSSTRPTLAVSGLHPGTKYYWRVNRTDIGYPTSPWSTVWSFTTSGSAGAAFPVTSTADSGAGSFRQAILDANARPGKDSIVFALAGGAGPLSISPLGPLPTITDSVVIDATTQPGYAGRPLVELDGSNAGAAANGLTLTAGNSVVKGLVIRRFGSAGVALQTGGNNVVEGNYIGTDTSGTVPMGNADNGVSINGSSNNLIGGTTPGAGNLLSGNKNNGLAISNPGSSHNIVEGNLIGTDASGTHSLGNDTAGVSIGHGTTDNMIGGTVPGARNIISGNHVVGIAIGQTGTTRNRVEGNFIGTNASGTDSVGNLGSGVGIIEGASGNTIGGTSSSAGNLISGNQGAGIDIREVGTTGNLVQGNLIGTVATGLASLGNLLGVEIINGASANIIGGTSSSSGNVVSGNGGLGILIHGAGTTGNLVQGNLIGTDATGSASLGNVFNGVSIRSGASGVTIGGIVAGARNIISENGRNGILIADSVTTNIVVQGNFIGTDSSGTAILGNRFSGVNIALGSSGNTIGGTVPAARNIISGNDTNGISIQSPGTINNAILGNYIGTNAAGTSGLGNGFNGIAIVNGAFANVIGGTNPGDRNIISGNTRTPDDWGVLIWDASFNIVQGNFIGTDISGNAPIPNGAGVVIYGNSTDNTIGGATQGAGNLISGNNGYIFSGTTGNGLGITGSGATGNMVSGNLIGTNAAGNASLPNTTGGVVIRDTAAHNVVGGAGPFRRNIISGNGGDGIAISAYPGTSSAAPGKLQRPGITLGIAGASTGLTSPGKARGTTGSGHTPGESEEIDATRASSTMQTTHGVRLLRQVEFPVGNVIQGNFIGTDVTGTLPLGNAVAGVHLTNGTTADSIGGQSVAAGNIISANHGDGVLIDGASTAGNSVEGNFIGTDASGTARLGNFIRGVALVGAPGNTIGGPTPAARNVISANNDGIGFFFAGAKNNLVQGNYIGTSFDGSPTLGNVNSGILVFGAPDNHIGGSILGAGNTIAGNATNGVTVYAPALGTTLLHNIIYSNALLGIDLGGDGVSLNHPCGVDTGANNLQNFPVLTSVTSTGTSTSIAGSISSAPNAQFTLEFFSNSGRDSSGYGEGENFLGSLQVTTDASCGANFATVLPVPVPLGQYVSATATDSAGNTSEFSQSILVSPPAFAISPRLSPAILGNDISASIPLPQNYPPATGLLLYRQAGTHIYDTLLCRRNGDSLAATIPAGAITIRGLEYYFRLQVNQFFYTYPPVSPDSVPIIIRVHVSTAAAGGIIQPQIYKMISVPMELNDPTITGVLDDDYGSYDSTRWRIFRWQDSSYAEYNSIVATILPGNAFWLITRNGQQFTVQDGQSVNSVRPDTVILRKGWNQFADPFAFAVSWDSVGRSPIVGNPVFYDNTQQYRTVNVLNPWEGYWLFDSAGGSILSIPPVEAPPGALSKTMASVDPEREYQLQLSATINSPRLKDSYNYVGLVQKGGDRKSLFNDLKPPPIGDYLQLCIIDGKTRYMSNYVSVPSDGQTWDVQVTSTVGKKAVDVALSEVGKLPGGFNRYVLDVDNFNVIPVPEGKFSIQLGAPRAIRSLKIILGTKEYAEKHSGGIPLVPFEYALFQNYPNPFNPETRIEYQLSKRSHVTLEVFNPLGQSVRMLVSAEQITGQYTAIWDGSNDQGYRVASGMYIYRIQATDLAGNVFVATRKLLLIR